MSIKNIANSGALVIIWFMLKSVQNNYMIKEMAIDSVSPKLLEPDIKALILNYLREKNLIANDSLIISEYTVGGYERRVDLVLFTNGKLIAFEIKSEADSLVRLVGQIHTYTEYFDKVIVVADRKFTSRIKSQLPINVGLWELHSDKIKVKARGKLTQKIPNAKLIEMMDVVDLSKLATSSGVRVKRIRTNLSASLLNSSNAHLRTGVEESLKRKYQKVTKEFLNYTSGRKVLKNDISILSRFKSQRDAQKQKLENSKKFWRNQSEYLKEQRHVVTD